MLYIEDSYLKQFNGNIININENKIILNKKIFFGKSGGQPGDTGTFYINGKKINIIDTIKDSENNIIHVSENNSELKVGQEVKGEIDWEKRYKHMRMHSALHVLCSVIPYGVTGGQIGLEKSRLDFDIKDNQINKDEIQNNLNILMKKEHIIDYKWITLEELDKQPELVRTMSVKPPRISGKIRLVKIGNLDLQPCGGTHVRNTNEIGNIFIQKIENKGKKNRRINIILN